MRKKRKYLQFLMFLMVFMMMALGAATTVSAATKYKVKFVDCFGSEEDVISTQTVVKGQAAVAPKELPTHKGYKFLRWNRPFQKVNSNITVKAVWQQYKSIIYFVDPLKKASGIFYSDGKPVDFGGYYLSHFYVIPKGASIPYLPKGPEHEGYTFTGWSKVEVGQKMNTIKTIISVAQYKKHVYRIKYEGGTGVTGGNRTKSYDYDDTVTLDDNWFTKKGYIFRYWKCPDTGKTYKDGSKFKIKGIADYFKSNDGVNYSIDFEPVWMEDRTPYSITYNLNGGEIRGSYLTTYTPSSPGFNLPVPEKEGYVFAGWTGTGLGSAKETVTIPTGSEGDRTYTATYVKERWLFVGDSYSTCGGKPATPDLIADYLSLSAYKNIGRGGFGMAKDKSGAYGKFIELLETEPSSRNITHIMIIGGITNDRLKSKAAIQAAIADFAKLAKKKFPNAKLYYAIGNWHADWKDKTDKASRQAVTVYRNRVLTRLSWYKSASKLNGITFLNGPEYALRIANNDSLFVADGHHPNLNGKKLFAKAVVKAYKSIR